jgi:Tol biopolymer transport system component
MHVRLRLFRLCTVVAVTLGWTVTAAASGVIANLTPHTQDAIASPDDGRPVNIPAGPPANLDSGVFRGVVDAMWRDSLTFRRQCQRLGVERGLEVKLLAQTSHRQSSVRASTEMSRKNGTLTLARVVVFSPLDAVELIAHEIEHIIEQLDGVEFLGSASTRTTRQAGAAYETGRAVEIGRVVAREVRETRGRVVMNLPQREQPGGALTPSSASVSADGRFIAFTSAARLAAADEDDDVDLYVLDVQTGRTTLESSKPGWPGRYRPILYPRISGNGRFVVFQAVADGGPESFPWQVVLLDRRDGTARVVSTDRHGRLANGHCTQAAISADGTTVVFESLATNLIESGDANGSVADILMVRLPDGGMTRVNVASDGFQPVASHSVTPAVSADGRYVAFMSTANLECGGVGTCAASGGGRKQLPEIYLRDTTRNVTSRVSRTHSGKNPNGPSSWPAVSGDGRVVAFVSEATNLVQGDGNKRADVFLHDTSTGATELVSRRPDGKFANGASGLPAVSGDGQTVAFQSFASDLICAKGCSPIEKDINMLLDVFVYNRSSGAMVRASLDEPGEWMETSHAPALDGSGQVLVFASRHPIGDEDSRNDDDLFIWMRGVAPTSTTLTRRY